MNGILLPGWQSLNALVSNCLFSAAGRSAGYRTGGVPNGACGFVIVALGLVAQMPPGRATEFADLVYEAIGFLTEPRTTCAAAIGVEEPHRASAQCKRTQ